MIVAKRIIRTGLAVSHEPIHAAVPAIDRVLAHRVSLSSRAQTTSMVARRTSCVLQTPTLSLRSLTVPG